MRVCVQSWALLVACLLFAVAPACAAGRPVQVCVQDQRGAPIVGARVQLLGNPAQNVAIDAGGCATVNVETQTMVEITRDGFNRVVRALGEESWLIFFFNVTATTEIYTLSLHGALRDQESSGE